MPTFEPVEGDPFAADPMAANPAAQPTSEAMGKWESAIGTHIGNELQRVYNAATLPGDVAAGRVEPTSDEAIRRATDLATRVTGGGFATTAEEGAAGMGIRAYHGSPHDFEKFDINKIGTGEGAQVYGRGLYFASKEEVADEYRKALAGMNTKWMEGDRVLSGAEQNAAELLNRVGGDKDKALTHVKYALRPMRTADQKYLDQTEAAIRQLDSSKIKAVQDPGKMYEVDIDADPEHFLDWDKPLSEQHPKVREAAKKMGIDEKVLAYDPINIDNSGAGIYTAAMMRPKGVWIRRPDEVAATAAFQEAGVPGIKYLDQGSRNAGQFHVSTEFRPEGDQYNVFGPGNIVHGKFDTREEARAFADQKNAEGRTSNYVVFNDKLIDIIKKYGLAGLVAGGAAHFKTTPVEHDPFKDNK